jgi:hypothetical protein
LRSTGSGWFASYPSVSIAVGFSLGLALRCRKRHKQGDFGVFEDTLATQSDCKSVPPVCVGAKNRPSQRASTASMTQFGLSQGDLAMTSGTMGLTLRNYDQDILELWDQHR